MLTIHKYPIYCELFIEVGKFGDFAVYKSYSVHIDHVAWRVENSICVNSDVYVALEKSQNFVRYLTAICEHEIKYSEFHTDCMHTEKDMEVLQYIRSYFFNPRNHNFLG